jgi:lysophospholipase L1-like esterase
VETAKAGGIEVAFLGDSITHLWSDTEVGGGKYAHGLKVWERTFGHLKPGNFGIAGDRTQHLLWRLRNGLMEGFKAHPPKLFVVLIGTNNQEDGAGEVAEGIRAILDEIRQNLASRIILLAIFPRGSPSDPLRAKNQTVNEKLRGMADGERVRFLDLGPRFLEADGRLSPGIMTDGLHLSEKGYERWAEGLLPVVREMLGSPKP